MAYSKIWDEAYPPNSLPANQIHIAIQYWAIAIRERLNDVFGTADWATAVQPFQPVQINFRGATPAIRGGSASLRFRNNADTLDNITLADAGDLTSRRNIISSNNLVSNNDLVFNAANARILPGSTTIRFRNFADTLDNLVISDAGVVSIRNSINTTLLALSGANPFIVGAAAGLFFRDSTNSTSNLIIADVSGDVSARGALAAPTLNINGVATLKQLTSIKVDQGNVTGAVTVDWTTGNYHYLTLIGNIVLTFNPPATNSLLYLRLKQDVVGTRGTTFPASVNPVPGPPSSPAGYSQFLELYWDGANYLVLTNNVFTL